jgi:hypothetical protein
MSAGDHLSEQQFFHGTAADVHPGDVIHPGSELGITNYPQLQHYKYRNTQVWTTPKESAAWHYAQHAEDRSFDEDSYGHKGLGGEVGRAKVVEVEPLQPATKARRLMRSDPPEHRMSSARVKRVIDIPPGEQGHLPISKSWDNWRNQWHPRDWSLYDRQPSEEPPKVHPRQGKLF